MALIALAATGCTATTSPSPQASASPSASATPSASAIGSTETASPSPSLLWASTGTKDKTASDVLYVEALAAPLTVNTMPEETLLAFADHGAVTGSIIPGVDFLGGRIVAGANSQNEALIARFEKEGVDIDELGGLLQQQGVLAFETAWRSPLARIKETAGAAVTR